VKQCEVKAWPQLVYRLEVSNVAMHDTIGNEDG